MVEGLLVVARVGIVAFPLALSAVPVEVILDKSLPGMLKRGMTEELGARDFGGNLVMGKLVTLNSSMTERHRARVLELPPLATRDGGRDIEAGHPFNMNGESLERGIRGIDEFREFEVKPADNEREQVGEYTQLAADSESELLNTTDIGNSEREHLLRN
jgi:hypothetical protein